ncbi:hypothetical protein [Tunturiibacter gelidoferens]|uniref:Uncharacterized protein n=1 Tax=Tunturiibacter gelidiferens TaxID=3069689 RepID=A0A9X0QC82_9BACT|nr:hypothetical protein [Edaphobacter lichenicola]MBB5327707.1 hypothetical protein [Edaphobacter lichenicola]
MESATISIHVRRVGLLQPLGAGGFRVLLALGAVGGVYMTMHATLAILMSGGIGRDL